MKFISLLFGIIWIGCASHLQAQPITPQTTTKIRGRVLDAKTNQALPFANIAIVGTRFGTQADDRGNYVLETKEKNIKLQATIVGYMPEVKTIPAGVEITVNFRLKSQINELQAATVKGKKERYRNKDNPAVELIRKVIDHKAQNRKEGAAYFQYEKYEKLQMDLSNVTEKFRNKRSLRKFDFIFNYLDTSEVTGKVNLPLYLKENLSDVYYRKEPKKLREYVKAEKMTSLGGYIDNNGIASYLDVLYQEINIYDNNIGILGTEYAGPVNPVAPNLYKFVLLDTLNFHGTKCVKLGFAPRNQTDMLFLGDMLIALDSSYAIRRVQMGFSKEVNINFVNDLRITQEFDPVKTEGDSLANGGQMLSQDELIIEFNLLKQDNRMGLYGRRSVSYQKYVLNQPIEERFFDGAAKVTKLPEAQKRDDNFWEKSRHSQLSKQESGIYQMVDSVQKVPAFRRVMNVATLLLSGWKPGRFFEIGPVNAFYSFNTVEGLRLRFGGRTAVAWNPRFVAEVYGAYGLRDERFKYFTALNYSLTDRSVYEYPVKRLRATAVSEIKIPGQELQFVNEDNFLLSFKRGVNNKMTYNQTFTFDYLNESASGFAINLVFKYLKQSTGGALKFESLNSDGSVTDQSSITSSELITFLRYAPNEKFYQGRDYRIPIVNEYPIIELQHVWGLKGVFNSQYGYHNLRGKIYKRFFMPPLGNLDLYLEGGKIFGSVPFPLLTIHRANQTYSYQPEAYNLMNFMEFISDHYASISIEHNFNGLLFNRIPLLRKLDWREEVVFKAMWGGLSDANGPSVANGLMRFPVDVDGNPVSFTLDHRPYIEAGVGIANVFKLFRVYLVKRLTYLEKPNVASGFAIRTRVRFDF
ncbi:MAG: DUF5686 family protein [Spirosomataceae bacterium]